jgi:hypothetical protein
VFIYCKVLYMALRQMNEKIDLDEIERKMYREANSDGIMELLLGILLFFMAGTWARSYFTVFLAFIPLYGNRVIEAFKKKFTYPRIGYVEFKQEEASIGWGILGYVLAVIAVVSIVATIFYGGNLEKLDVYRWVPLALGAIFLGSMIYLHSKSGDPVVYLYSFVTLVAGGIFTFYGFESSMHSIQLYLLSLAGFFLIAGMIRLLTFKRRNPVLVMPDADE